MKKLFSVLAFLFSCSNILFATELIVQLHSSNQLEHFYQQAQKNYPGLKFSKTLSKSWNIYLFEISESRKEKCITELSRWSEVQHIQPNRKAQPRQTAPNDPGYAQQWHHNNTGQSGGTIGADIQSELAWDLFTGSSAVNALGDSIVIAIVDEGIDLQSNDLKLWKNQQEIPNNGVDDDGNGYIDDYHGWNAFAQNGVILQNNHGTKVAGIAAALGNNNFGIAGVHWNAQIMPVAVSEYSEAEIILAYSYLFDQRKLYNQSNGAQGAYIVVANSSFGVDNAFEDEFQLWCSLYDSLGSVGILSIAAATNIVSNVDETGDIPSLCSSPYLIAVTSTSRNDQLSSAGYGKENIDLAAPGTAIYTIGSNNQFGASSGTSYSAPLVTGAAALLHSAACDSFYFKNSIAEIPLKIRQSILDGAEWLSVLTSKTKTNGRLNVYKSMELFLSGECVSCMDIAIEKNEITCIGDNDGKVNVQISEAIAPFSFQWNDNSSDSFRFALKTGQYFLTVTDSQSCEKVIQVRFQDPDPIELTLNASPETNNETNGTATVIASGGRPPYVFNWSNGDTLDSLFNLSAGWYYLSMRDQDGQGCLALDSVYVDKDIVGVEMQNSIDIELFPNPSSNKINLKFENLSSIDLMDLKGNSLQKHNVIGKNTLRIYKNDLPTGIYLLQITDNNQQVDYRKIIFH